MNCIKTGHLIKSLRLEKNLTQKELADKMNLSDKTISKWERGLGSPDISLLNELSYHLNTTVENILSGDIITNERKINNMRNSKFYYCPECNNIIVSVKESSIICCSKKIMPLVANKALDNNKLYVEKIENEWFISSNHPMKKDNYIAFVALADGEEIQITQLYPEWDMQLRISGQRHGILFWYSTTEGLFYQTI